jgi:hypothetical protein
MSAALYDAHLRLQWEKVCELSEQRAARIRRQARKLQAKIKRDLGDEPEPDHAWRRRQPYPPRF